MNRPLTTSTQVWEFLTREGGLDTRLYDKPIETDIRQNLALPLQGELSKLLKDHAVSVEDLLAAFFHSIQPISLMMSELLAMFESAGATRSAHNISIELDFEKGVQGLTFDLNHFHKWIEEWKQVRRSVSFEIWNYNILWRLITEQSRPDRTPQDNDVRKWIAEYQRSDCWPETQIDPPITGSTEFDNMTRRLWRVWSTVLAKCKALSSGRRSLQEIAAPEKSRDLVVFESSGEVRDWTVWDLWILESDYWLRAFMTCVYLLAEEITRSSGKSRTELITRAIAVWEHILADISREATELDSWEKELKSFLELPIWKKRHELYSVWVCTQIVRTYSDTVVNIHHYKGQLLFSFAGSHIATIGPKAPFLQLWAELRTPLSNPIGKGRSKAIQPDYSLCFDPSTHPGTTAIAIECKQYLKASPKRFSEALIDYAHGRPNARIVLVNYGEVRADVVSCLPDDIKERCFVVAPLRPDHPKQIDKFKHAINVPAHALPGDMFAVKAGDEGADIPGRIVLKWGESPADLDLHLNIPSKEHTCVCYRNEGSRLEPPWCEYETDVRHGSGPESIRIEKWLEGNYVCYVHNYSNESLLAGQELIIELICGGYSKVFRCQSDGTGRWWRAFEIRVEGNCAIVTEANQIEDHNWSSGCVSSGD